MTLDQILLLAITFLLLAIGLMQRWKYIFSSIVMASQGTERTLRSCGLHHVPLEDREEREVASGAGWCIAGALSL
jgi:hypothetical protein